ncbi:VirB8/TrbF family protein [Ramlibacter alkalitolerans]|uniref:Type IV secretion system protein n=1 Tax=Ramlibacter alkalitolerans TaxID=2039631 RepID=A0ABS1JU78_9BURK|nr:VirB8/TrbF family protein [Ramlibacter alkalitolerans]MBL0427784.1 type IV secretion system protein [Ramlibacter alkalitolerans]
MSDYTEKDRFLEAKREWNERFGSYIKRAHSARVLAAVLGVGLVISAAGNVFQGLQSKVVPYVVEVDRLGHSVAVGQVTPSSVTSEKLVKFMLAGFISDARSVVSDGSVLKKQFARVKVMADSPVQSYLADYFKLGDAKSETNPVVIARTATVNVEVASVLPISKDTWQIDWTEERRALDGTLEGKSQWKAIATIKIQPPENEEMARLNPLGIYITQLSWSRVLTK